MNIYYKVCFTAAHDTNYYENKNLMLTWSDKFSWCLISLKLTSLPTENRASNRWNQITGNSLPYKYRDCKTVKAWAALIRTLKFGDFNVFNKAVNTSSCEYS